MDALESAIVAVPVIVMMASISLSLIVGTALIAFMSGMPEANAIRKTKK